MGEESPRSIVCKKSKVKPADIPVEGVEPSEVGWRGRRDLDGNWLVCWRGHDDACEFLGAIRYLADWQPFRVSVGADYYLKTNHRLSNAAAVATEVAKQEVTEQPWGHWYRFIESLNEVQQEKDEPTFVLGGDIPHEPEIRMSNEQ